MYGSDFYHLLSLIFNLILCGFFSTSTETFRAVDYFLVESYSITWKWITSNEIVLLVVCCCCCFFASKNYAITVLFIWNKSKVGAAMAWLHVSFSLSSHVISCNLCLFASTHRVTYLLIPNLCPSSLYNLLKLIASPSPL